MSTGASWLARSCWRTIVVCLIFVLAYVNISVNVIDLRVGNVRLHYNDHEQQDNDDDDENEEEEEEGKVFSSTAAVNNNDAKTSSSSSSVSIISSAALLEKRRQQQFRFPSVEERVEYYMGSWYDGSKRLLSPALCEEVPFYDPESGVRWNDLPLMFNRATILSAKAAAAGKTSTNPKERKSSPGVRKLGVYTGDAWENVFRHHHGTNDDFRAIMMMGDWVDSDPDEQTIPYPVMMKARLASYGPTAYAPILVRLRVLRHYASLNQVRRIKRPIAWDEKKEVLVWRGASTGFQGERFNVVRRYVDDEYSNLMDVGFNHALDVTNDGDSASVLKSMVKPGMNITEQLRYKYLLSLEGNDVASGLKWMLYSNSVVFMAPPTRVSWAMEDKLVPFYHYVPLKPDHSDLIEMIRWAREHDEICMQISQHATEYMENLYASKEAENDNEEVSRRMVERYHKLYGPAMAKCEYPKKNANSSYLRRCNNNNKEQQPVVEKYDGPWPWLKPCDFFFGTTTTERNKQEISDRIMTSKNNARRKNNKKKEKKATTATRTTRTKRRKKKK